MIHERRRTTRASPLEAMGMHTELKHRVKLLDISLSGVLLSANTAMLPGTRGRLRTSSPGCVLDLPFEVQRCRPAGFSGLWSVAARFGDLDESNRRSLERFLQRASE